MEPQQKRPRIHMVARYAIELCAGSARVSAAMNRDWPPDHWNRLDLQPVAAGSAMCASGFHH